jgi:quinoprotein glucose dehydrogenase
VKRTLGFFFLLALLSAATVRSQSDRSVWDAVYTQEQATRGQAAFVTSCSRCHAAQDFTGETFLGSWESSSALDLLRVLQKSMPEDNPGSLPPEQYADIVAYFFSLNMFPAGKAELDTNAERLGAIRIKAKP